MSDIEIYEESFDGERLKIIAFKKDNPDNKIYGAALIPPEVKSIELVRNSLLDKISEKLNNV